jgi:hypothetical protein
VGLVGLLAGVEPTPKDWTLQIEANPPTSPVTVDGRPQGASPVEVNARPGKVRVTLTHQGYKPLERDLTLGAEGGVMPLRWELEPEGPLGHVLLDVTPHDARVWLDDEPPLTPNAQGRFEFHRPPGKLKVHLAREGYQTVTREVEVPTRSTLSNSIELRPLPIRVEVKPSRPAQGRVVLEADGDFRTECSLPCEARVPTPGEVRVKVSLDASPNAPPWGAARAAKPGERVTFLVPVEPPPPEPEARLRASITGKTPEGTPLRASLLDANLLRQPQGAGRQKLPTGQTVTLRYEFAPGTRRLQVSLASDPWSNLTLDGAPAGQTPLVGREISPGNHRLVLVEHGLTVSLRYSLVLE